MLSTGTKLGPYEIVAPLGAGGMGVVYLAKDTRLDRDVAIKALPEHLAQDPDRLARFEREARTLAQLTHPNVAGIYGVEEHEGARYLVLEYVEGETLAARLDRGALPVDEALEIAVQIAAGVEAAHEAGVIHRDLKPGNVIVTPDGKAKVLDFGLARAEEASSSSTHMSPNSPTLTSPAVQHSPTMPGVILGTAAYMSPEQARGRKIDKRTDIWSFGVTLYEMLTGSSPFVGETVSDSIGAVLHKEIDFRRLPPETPWMVRHVIRRCLARNRSDRYRDIGDVLMELEGAIADPTSSSLGLATAATAEAFTDGRRSRRRFVATSSLVTIAAALAGFIGWNLKTVPESGVRKFMLGGTDYEPQQGIAISPDGRKIVYSSGRRLWVREIDKLEPRELRGTDLASQPIWSPDSTRIAYATENKLWHISWQGDSPTAIGTLPTAMLPVGGLSWTEDGRIFIATGNTGLHEVSARGGEVRTILEVDPVNEEDFHHAAALPGGRGVLFTVHRKTGGPDKIDLWTPEGRKTLLELEGERLDNPVYSPTGHILYQRSTTTPGLWALPFSFDTLKVAGEPFLVNSDGARPAVSDNGTLVFIRGWISALNQLVWVDREGKVLETVGQPQAALGLPRLSPDGRRVAVEAYDPDARNIWIHDIERKTKMRLTFDQISPGTPVWIHGNDQIAYSTGGGGQGPAFIKNADGTGQPRELPIIFPTSCSNDGRYLLFRRDRPDGNDDVWYYPLDGQGDPAPLVQGKTQARHPIFSPDGTLVAYQYRDAALEEIFLTTFPSGEGRWQVSTNSGVFPVWSPKGDEIFYIEPGSFGLMSVSVQREPTIALGTPKRLFSGSTPGVAIYPGYDVDQDGQRFLMIQINDPEKNKRGIVVVENWFAEFEDRQ